MCVSNVYLSKREELFRHIKKSKETFKVMLRQIVE